MIQQARLPLIDEHTALIGAPVERAWSALVETLERACSRRAVARYTRIVGCADTTVSGPRPFAEGASIPGFRVAAVVPGRELVLEGRHRFSSYALCFRLEQLRSGSSLLRAESRADFPGIAGGVYRLAVITTRAHVFAVRRLLAAVGRRAGPRLVDIRGAARHSRGGHQPTDWLRT